MDMSFFSILVAWMLVKWVGICVGELTTHCTSDSFGLPMTCCYDYGRATSRGFRIECPEGTSSITIVDVVHLYGTSFCTDGDNTHNCSISNFDIAWRLQSFNETCLTTSNICAFEIDPIQAYNSCNGTVANTLWTDTVVLTFNCTRNTDSDVSTTITSTNFASDNGVVPTSQKNEPNSTPNKLPADTTHYDDDKVTSRYDDDARTSRYTDDSYSSVMPSALSNKPLDSTTPQSKGNMTETLKPTAQQSSVAGAIGGGIAAGVAVIVIVIIIILLVRRRKLQEESEKKNDFDDAKSNANGHTYIDIDSTKANPHKSKYEKAKATQEKDFPLKHCDSHETSHYCYVGSNECHGKGHTNDEEKPQYDNVENMTYDTPKTNRVDKQDQNHYDNINEEVENKNNERIDLYAVPNKAKTGVSGDNNKMSLKRNMDGSEYSIYPTLPAKCFDTPAEDPDLPKYAEIDMEKSGISASSRKNVDAKPSEDLNYAQIQF